MKNDTNYLLNMSVKAAQLSAVKTLPELFDFWAKLKAERDAFSAAWYDEGAQANSKHLKDRHETQFFIDRVEAQIKSLESNGVFLAAVDGREVVRDSNDLVLEKPEAFAPWGSSPIEQKAEEKELVKELKRVQSKLKEGEWGIINDKDCDGLWVSDIITKADGLINGKRVGVYLWRHDMDYINFLTKNPPKN